MTVLAAVQATGDDHDLALTLIADRDRSGMDAAMLPGFTDKHVKPVRPVLNGSGFGHGHHVVSARRA